MNMQSLEAYLAFLLICLAMVMSPGPNMIYLISRSIAQGKWAGFISLGGVVLGFLTYMLLVAVGLSVVLLAVPFAYDTIRLAGAAYLMWLAWQTVPGGSALFQIKQLKHDSQRKLFWMGYMTSLLNPKVALLYVSLLPQFVDTTLGNPFLQTLFLGVSQITVSFLGNCFWIFTAGHLAIAISKHPVWGKVQRWVMGGLLASFAVRIALDARR
jgi:threonine/homoserine/homoserine lactone efflux protein